MEALGRLSNVNPGNPTGDPAVSNLLNQQARGAIQDYQDWGAGNRAAVDQAVGPWPGKISDYLGEVMATPGVGAIIPGGGTGGGIGRDMALRNPWLQPTLDHNVLQVLRVRPELMEWYKAAAGPDQKKDIIDFITRNYVGR